MAITDINPFAEPVSQGCDSEPVTLEGELEELTGVPPASPESYWESASRWITDKVGEALSSRADVDDPELRLEGIRRRREELQARRNERRSETAEQLLATKASSQTKDLHDRREMARLDREEQILRSCKNANERGNVRSIDQSRRAPALRYTAAVVAVLAVLAFWGVAHAMAGSSSVASGPSATIRGAASPKANPGVSTPARPNVAPTLAPTVIPSGFVQATKVGSPEAIARDSYVPPQAPASVAIWRQQIMQVSADPRIVAAGNYNIFASSLAPGNVNYGSQAMLYKAVLTGSGGKPNYYYKGANGVVLEGLVPLTPTKGKLIAAEMGITFNPYGPCNPQATVQPVTCGTLNSLLIAARYFNDIAAVTSASGRFAVYKAQAIAGLAGAKGAFLPLDKLSDITCAWHPELRDAKTQNLQCDLAAALAYAWRNNTLFGSPLYREMLATKSFAQLLAQAKAELVREKWLK